MAQSTQWGHVERGGRNVERLKVFKVNTGWLVKFGNYIRWVWYLEGNIDQLNLLNSKSVGVFCWYLNIVS